MELAATKYTWDSPFLRSRKSFSRLTPVWKSKTSITNAEDLANVEKILKCLPLNRETDSDSILKENLIDHLVDLLRFSLTAVNPDTKRTAFNMMKRLSVNGVDLPDPIYRSPSGFISDEQFPFVGYDAKSEDFDDLLTQEPIYYQLNTRFNQFGRLENFLQVMALHPEFLDTFSDLHCFLLETDSLMPYDERYFLAIMAAAELRCTYLVYLFARKFILYGGKNSWLLDPLLASDKLKRLASLNWLLAHQPWNITKKDMESLSISVSELTFAICLMAHVHALSCFVFATGVRPEIDHPGGCSFTLVDRTHSGPKRSETSNGHNRRKSGTLNTKDLAATEFVKLLNNEASDLEEDSDRVYELFMAVIKENCDLNKKDPQEWSSRLSCMLDELDAHPVLQRFLAFNAERPTGYSSFVGAPYQVQTFPWDNDAQAEINQLYEELGNHIGRNFSQANNLTYHTVNEVPNVDTSVYRRTIWNTVQSFFGICHDDFDYERIGIFVTDKQRVFLKRCATRPYEIGVKQERYSYASLMPAFKASEVVHVMLMMMEARRQACLLYATRAIYKFRLSPF